MVHKDLPAVLTDWHTFGCTSVRTDMRVCMHGCTGSRSLHFNPIKSPKVKTSAGLSAEKHTHENIPKFLSFLCVCLCVSDSNGVLTGAGFI